MDIGIVDLPYSIPSEMMCGFIEDQNVYDAPGDVTEMAEMLMRRTPPKQVTPMDKVLTKERQEEMKKRMAEADAKTKKANDVAKKAVVKPAAKKAVKVTKTVVKEPEQDLVETRNGLMDMDTIPQTTDDVVETSNEIAPTNDAEQYMHFRRDTTWKMFVITNGVFHIENFNQVRPNVPDQDFRRENLFVINCGDKRIDLSTFGIDYMNACEVPGWKDFGPKYSEYSVLYNLSTLFRNKLEKIPAIGFMHYDMHTGTGFRDNPSLYSAIEYTYVPQSEKFGLMMLSTAEYTKLYNRRFVMDYDQPQIFSYNFMNDLMNADRYGFLHNMCDTCMQILNSEYHLGIGDPARFTSAKLSGGRTFIMQDAAFMCASGAAIDIMDMVRRIIDSGVLRPFENSTYDRAISMYLSCLVGIYTTRYATRTCFTIPHESVLARMEKIRG